MGFAIVVLWLLSGIYIVNPDEQGVVLRFGKYDRTEGPGPHYAWPVPIESVYKPQVTQVLRSEVGFRSVGQAATFQQGQLRTIPEEASMLTGDENIVNVQFSVQYKISDPVDYLFNVTAPAALVRNAAEAAMLSIWLAAGVLTNCTYGNMCSRRARGKKAPQAGLGRRDALCICACTA